MLYGRACVIAQIMNIDIKCTRYWKGTLIWCRAEEVGCTFTYVPRVLYYTQHPTVTAIRAVKVSAVQYPLVPYVENCYQSFKVSLFNELHSLEVSVFKYFHFFDVIEESRSQVPFECEKLAK